MSPHGGLFRRRAEMLLSGGWCSKPKAWWGGHPPTRWLQNVFGFRSNCVFSLFWRHEIMALFHRRSSLPSRYMLHMCALCASIYAPCRVCRLQICGLFPTFPCPTPQPYCIFRFRPLQPLPLLEHSLQPRKQRRSFREGTSHGGAERVVALIWPRLFVVLSRSASVQITVANDDVDLVLVVFIVHF